MQPFWNSLEDLNLAVRRILSFESWKTIIAAVKLFNIQISQYEALLISAVFYVLQMLSSFA